MDPDGDRVEYTIVWRVNGQKAGNSRMAAELFRARQRLVFRPIRRRWHTRNYGGQEGARLLGG